MLLPDSSSGGATGVPDEDAAPGAARLAVPVPPVGPDALCAALLERFAADPALGAVAVLADGRPDGAVLGLVDRAALSRSDPGHRDRPVHRFMDPEPLVVEAALPLVEVGRRIARDKPGALTAGFVVVEGGRYRGVGSGMDLMVASVELAALRTGQFHEALRAAEAATRAKTAFLASMSHEIRTPLNAMMGFAELLEQEVLGPHANPLYREYASDIAESGRHLMALINDLLDLAKAEADRLELKEGQVDVRRVAAGSARLLAERAARAGVRIETALPSGLPPLRADERSLRQMLLNLLSNAVKFTPPDGVVTLSGRVAGDGSLALSVHDTGIGMTPDELAKALEPWGQIDSALSRNHVGTGLGLPLTRRLVELHGGRLEIASSPNDGTTMTLVFPAERVVPG